MAEVRRISSLPPVTAFLLLFLLAAEGHAASATFSFLFIADTSQKYYAEALRFAYENYRDLKMAFYTYDFQNPSEDTCGELQKEWERNLHADTSILPLFFILGNHDIEHPEAVNYQVKTLGPLLAKSLPGMRNFREGPYDTHPLHGGYEDRYLQYSFEYGNALFIVLNSYHNDTLLGLDRFKKEYAPGGCMTEEQLAWLEGLLKGTKAVHRFVFMHEPAYPPPGTRHAGDSLDNCGCPGNCVENPEVNPARPMRERFWALLAKHKMAAVFSGHNHNDSQTWVGHPYEIPGSKIEYSQLAPVYEIVGGELGSTGKIVIVQVGKDQVIVSPYEAPRGLAGTARYSKKSVDIVIDRNPEQPNHPPKILQFTGGENYQPTDRKEVRFQVGTSISGADALYFEARDNNVHDKIIFTVDKIPPFLVAGNQNEQFRRITFTTPIEYQLSESDVGIHTLALRATDGRLEGHNELIISVLPASKSKVPGTVIRKDTDKATSVHGRKTDSAIKREGGEEIQAGLIQQMINGRAFLNQSPDPGTHEHR